MARKNPENLTRHSIKLFEGDLETLQAYYPTLGASHVLRILLRRHLKELRERNPTLEPIQVDL